MQKRIPVYLVAGLAIFMLTGCNLPSSKNNNTTQTANIPAIAATLFPTDTIVPTPTSTPQPETRISLGDLALMEGETDGARQQYHSAAIDSNDTELQAAAMLGIGRAYLQDNNDAQAVSSFQAVIDEMPANQSQANAYYFLAEAYLQQEQYQSAAEAFGKYIELKPGILDDVIYDDQAEAYMSAEMYPEAIQAFQSAVNAMQTGDKGALYLRIGQAYQAQSNWNDAVTAYLKAYDESGSDYTSAQANLLAGQVYLQLGFPDQAYARFQDSIEKFPKSYDSYSGLVALVNDDQPVNDLYRGIVDYYAGQYGYAAEALRRYIDGNLAQDGTASYYRGLALLATDDYPGAISAWQYLIQNYPGDQYYSDAFSEIAYTQWGYQDDYQAAAATYQSYVTQNPNATDAADMLYSAARTLERGNYLVNAASLWEGMMDQYPSSEMSWQGLFMGGITQYRLKNYQQAQSDFQRDYSLATTPDEQAQALMWIGKTQAILGDQQSAIATWNQTALLDPTNYYSERAAELADNETPLQPPAVIDLGVDMETERSRAETWLRTTFNIPADTDLSGLAGIQDNPEYIRGQALWQIGQYQKARDEFESVRNEIQEDPLLTYRFMNEMLSIGAYRPAIFASRQILNLAGYNDTQTIQSPPYFNYIRFGVYFKDLVLSRIERDGLEPPVPVLGHPPGKLLREFCRLHGRRARIDANYAGHR